MHGLNQLTAALVATIVISGSDAPETKISGSQYWFFKLLSRLEVTRAGDRMIAGVIRRADRAEKFVADRKDVDSPTSKVQGALRAIDFYLALLRDAETDTKLHVARDELQRLTGEDFASLDEWRSWLHENRAFVIFSDEKQRLVLDAEAKKHGIPALEYRREKHRS